MSTWAGDPSFFPTPPMWRVTPLLATETKHPLGSRTGIRVTFHPCQLVSDTEPGCSYLSLAGGYEGKLIRSRN